MHGQSFRVAKLSLGYVYDFVSTGPLRGGQGGVVGVPRAPAALDAAYGHDPMSHLIFLQARIAP